mmetsp:Transcript_26422/g.26672  ORF Transcript_26422/g.26672 Transcript_26422/m.26672 type:complete len:164 (+) Transcript_26422:65-556(+)|eukprot:CAMPEP_0182427336 /NCGR_PEP_ID=MMETSP1167-20130531/17094_1 /TAXON_ID=2988 /ORGANISM="Mallomonas Sp, Strain CCMP3275" /LENGTH=163 /DNA_ID=CAMNT_0024609503 /DNA_START=63 /DNA_END=554 /DNA_ORIENTATION=-
MLCRILSKSLFRAESKAFFQAGTRATFSTYKTSTGLVGLAVDKNGRANLLDISSDILASVQKIPATSEYRVNVEKWFTYISKVAKSTDDIKLIETEIGLGQIEELIDMAKTERQVVDYYYDNKGWERCAEAEKDADGMLEAMKDSIYFNDPSKSSTDTDTPVK